MSVEHNLYFIGLKSDYRYTWWIARSHHWAMH